MQLNSIYHDVTFASILLLWPFSKPPLSHSERTCGKIKSPSPYKGRGAFAIPPFFGQSHFPERTNPYLQVQILLIYPGIVTLPLASKPTFPCAGLSVCGSQIHSISALVSAHTCPDSLNLAGNLLFLFSAFTLLIYYASNYSRYHDFADLSNICYYYISK